MRPFGTVKCAVLKQEVFRGIRQRWKGNEERPPFPSTPLSRMSKKNLSRKKTQSAVELVSMDDREGLGLCPPRPVVGTAQVIGPRIMTKGKMLAMRCMLLTE